MRNLKYNASAVTLRKRYRSGAMHSCTPAVMRLPPSLVIAHLAPRCPEVGYQPPRRQAEQLAGDHLLAESALFTRHCDRWNPRWQPRWCLRRPASAKTNVIDAGLLTCFGAMVEPRPLALSSTILLEMKDLLVARRALIKGRT